MKTPSNFLFLVLLFYLFMLLAFTGCKTANNDSIVGTWEMTQYRINHFDEHKDINITWRFEKNGHFHQTINYPQQVVSETAEWIKSADDTLIIQYTEKRSKVKWRIAYMDDSILEIEHITPGFFVERRFEKK
jgi:hypothetical protein